MSIGEHLDELRRRLIKSLLALVLAVLVCLWPAKYLLELVARPVMIALDQHDQAQSFLQTHPAETILIYMKVVVFAAIIIASPYILYQAWAFVGVGLYSREKQWVYKLIPTSVGLFLTGVVFMYFFVLPLSMNFLVGFNEWLPMPRLEPTPLERALLGTERPAVDTQPAEPLLNVPVRGVDPDEPPAGSVWFNQTDHTLKVQTDTDRYTVRLRRGASPPMVAAHFRIGEYLSFVLMLTLAFGAAFQMPIVVVFLVGARIVTIPTLQKSRRMVILVIVVIAAFIAPPDLLSHLLLSGPMILLFEIGLLLAKRRMAKEAAAKRAEVGG